MKIILLKDIAKVGKKYDIKEMSDGYAQNMLIPRGLAVAATADVLKRIELEKARDEGEKKLHRDLILKNLKDLEDKTIEITEKKNDKGHLFASVHASEIVKAIKKQTQLDVHPDHIVLAKPIKEAGVHTLEVKAEGLSIKFNLDIK